MITKSLRSTIYTWMIFERWLLHLGMLLLWLSWTKWVWCHERVVADLLHFRMFLYNRICVFHWLQVFDWRGVDCDLAIGLCTLLSKTEVFKILWKVIDNTWQNYDKILVGNMLNQVIKFDKSTGLTSYTCRQRTVCLRRRWSLYSWSRGKRIRVTATIRSLSRWPKAWWSTSTASRARSGLKSQRTRSPKSCHQVWPADYTLCVEQYYRDTGGQTRFDTVCCRSWDKAMFLYKTTFCAKDG